MEPATHNRRRLPGIDLRQGAVKQARLEAGLSLAQVGKGHVTAPAIYLIETGRTRPSLPTLEHIAHRTGKPIDFFLADPGGAAHESHMDLLELETLCAAMRFTEAAELGRKLLATATTAHGLGRIRYLTACALLNLARPAEAAPLLQDAHDHFEASDDRLMLAECLGAQASLANLTHAPGDVELAEHAIEVCRSLDPVPRTTEARLLGILANCLVTRKDWDRAIEVYGQAIEAAGAVRDLYALASMYGGVSSAYRAIGHLDSAMQFAHRTIALLEVVGDQCNLSRLENNLGLVLLARGDQKNARRYLDRTLPPSEASALGRSNVLLSIGELSLADGDAARARELAQQALDIAMGIGERRNVAEAHMSLGRAAEALGETDTCDQEFGLAIAELVSIGAEDCLLNCHGIYAEILERRGEMVKAYAHMKKAFAASRPGMLDRDDESGQKANLA